MAYLTFVKALFVQALNATFDGEYPNEKFRSVRASIESPVKEQEYPSIWVDYADSAALVKAGIAHVENKDPVTGDPVAPFTRWRFTGSVSFTVAALTSLECDRLWDEVVKVVAFGVQDPLRGRFRRSVEENPLVTADVNYDQIEVAGPGGPVPAPWGTDDLVYERTLMLDLIGECYPSPVTGDLVLLSKIVVDAPRVDLDLSGTPLIPAAEGSGPTAWH